MHDTSSLTIAPAQPEDLADIAELQRRHYGPLRAVAQPRLEVWYATNPGGFLVFRDGVKLVGHATLLPLRPEILDALLNGSKTESDIESRQIFAPAERALVRDVYIESVIAEGIEVLGEFVRTFDIHVARIANPDLLEALYVCPLTPLGERLATNLQFQPIARGNATSNRMYRADCATLLRHTAAVRLKLEALRSTRVARP